jgi:hypothetical protein
MSRRTKLLLTAPFLVLLAIPGIYIALTWSPPMPLRFRVLRVHTKPPYVADAYVPVLVSVENSGFHPVHLLMADARVRDISSTEAGSLGHIYPETQDPEGFGEGATEPFIIPAHRTVELWAMILGDAVHQAENGQLQLTCLWLTGTKYRAYDLRESAHTYIPSWLNSRVPRLEFGIDEAALDAMVEP